ncbi:MAG: hypothetical protein U0P45_06330 [Acidimicrobiales bacterium]
MPTPRSPRSFGALALALAIAVPVAVGNASPASARSSRHRCDRVAYVLGDSRRTLEHEVLPRTTDRVWEAQLGIRGDASGRHVRYLAEPGVVHERFATELEDLMDACGRTERPLLFDFMGTNYAAQDTSWISDPSWFDAREADIAAFYDAHAPQARVVLAELTLDQAHATGAYADLTARYLDGYNAALRDLAQRQPGRFFFLPAPSVYRDGTIQWRDLAHETFEAPLAEHLGLSPEGDLDQAALDLMDAADGSPCALLDDERFGVARYSEGAALGAYLQDFHASRAARAWLRDRSVAPDARIHLDDDTTTCDYATA